MALSGLPKATYKKIRKINLLIFGCLLQRRKNHAFSSFVSCLTPGYAGRLRYLGLSRQS